MTINTRPRAPLICNEYRGARIRSSLALLMFVSAGFLGSAIAAESQLGEYQETATVTEIAGEAWARNFTGMIDADAEIEWSVNVPENYKPDSPAGVVVYISPSNSGAMPWRWKSVMEENNLIWIAANQSGNKVNPRLRVSYSLLAPVFIDKYYNIDVNRIYVAGLSGGGRVASIVAPEYSALFRGAIYICGVNRMRKEFSASLAASDAHRFVFLTGENDFNRKETKNVYSAYRRAGVENSLYLEIRKMGHENPDARGFAKAIAYLDDRER